MKKSITTALYNKQLKTINMPISNETFETFRSQQRAVERNKAIVLLCSEGYTVFDTEGNMLNKTSNNTYK